MNSLRHRNIHHSDVVLDGTYYLAWKLTLRRLLDGIRVLGHIDGTTLMPAAPSLPDSSSSSIDDAEGPPQISQTLLDAYEKKLNKLYVDDANAKVMICQTVVLEIHSQIPELPTVRDM